jgi:hypothetical protein
MGRVQHTREGNGSTRGRCLRPRVCLRQGCGRTYQPQRWNQRYCQDPDCRCEVRRWHAAKRQRRRRGDAHGREKHARAERDRRERCRAEGRGSSDDGTSSRATPSQAWSRSKAFPKIFCDRPGCYEGARSSDRAPARYCSDACRRAMGRVRDRERKWLHRKTSAGRYKRQLEYERVRTRRRRRCCGAPGAVRRDLPATPGAVVNYRASPSGRLIWPGWKEDRRDDRETSADSRPRPPPAS